MTPTNSSNRLRRRQNVVKINAMELFASSRYQPISFKRNAPILAAGTRNQFAEQLPSSAVELHQSHLLDRCAIVRAC